MPRLVANVFVPDRGWFGPAYGNEDAVPDDVVGLIGNPAAWEGDSASEDAPGESSGSVTADQAPQEPSGDDKAESGQPARTRRTRKQG